MSQKPLVSREYPETHLLNPRFRYRRACETDVAATIAAEQQRLELERAEAAANETERGQKVLTMRRMP